MIILKYLGKGTVSTVPFPRYIGRNQSRILPIYYRQNSKQGASDVYSTSHQNRVETYEQPAEEWII